MLIGIGSSTTSVLSNPDYRNAIARYGSMILRPSQKLNAKIKAGPLRELPLDDDPYADWSCHLFSADRTQYILLTNTKSLYSCVLFGKGVTSSGLFIERAMSNIREFMEYDGQTFAYQKFIAPASGSVTFAKARNPPSSACGTSFRWRRGTRKK